MTNVTVVFEYEEPEYCRLCLSEATDNNELATIGGVEGDIVQTIRELLAIELDSGDSSGFICQTCLESLEEFSRYRKRCRVNNAALKRKASERQQRQLELAKSAIENTNVLDQVSEGEPIKVVIRMNAEGKASIRLQVQSKSKEDPSSESNPPKPSTSTADLSRQLAITQQKAVVTARKPPSARVTTPPAAPAPKQPPKQPNIPTKKTTNKSTEELLLTAAGTEDVSPLLIRLPSQPFYFYKANITNYGLIYGGYRYCGSIPRKQRTLWSCEQRRTCSCSAVFLADRKYTNFYLTSGHNHDPPRVLRNVRIFKASVILRDVIEQDRVKEIQAAQASKSKEVADQLDVAEVRIKDEEDTSSDEDTFEDEPSSGDEAADEHSVGEEFEIFSEEVEAAAVEALGEEPEEKPLVGDIKVEDDSNMYIIQELT